MQIETLPRRKHSISLTPLIDVVFILLLFFVLATSFTDWRQITLATGTTAMTEQTENTSVVVRVTPDGTLRYDGKSYRIATLIPLLQRQNRSGDLSAIIIHPDADTTLAPTVAALDALAATGLPVALSRPAVTSAAPQP